MALFSRYYGTVSAASFNITGDINYTYTITLPQSVVLSRLGGSETIVVDDFKSLPANTGVLNNLGAQALNIGATLRTDANQPAGIYATVTPFEVMVNYN